MSRPAAAACFRSSGVMAADCTNLVISASCRCRARQRPQQRPARCRPRCPSLSEAAPGQLARGVVPPDRRPSRSARKTLPSATWRRSGVIPPCRMPVPWRRASEPQASASSSSLISPSSPNPGPIRSATNSASPRPSIAATTNGVTAAPSALSQQGQIGLVLDLVSAIHGDVSATRPVEHQAPHLDEELAVPESWPWTRTSSSRPAGVSARACATP